MGLQIYGNIDAGSLLTGKVQSATNLVASGIKNLVAGDGLEVELFLTSQTGLVNIQDYSVRLGIGDLNARPTGGTWDLGSETGLAYNISASNLQTAITNETAANTTTELSPFVFKTVFTANGLQTIPTIDSTSLTPNSTVSIVKLVTGDGSTQEQWLTRIFRNPIAFQDTWTNFTKTGVGNGISGALGLGTAEIYDQFSESVTSFSTTMEMEVTDTNGNVTTVFQIPVTIGGEVLGAGITASSISPSNFVTASDVNTSIDTATTRTDQLHVSASRGNDATASRNSTTNPYQTFAGALADAQSNDSIIFEDGDFRSEATLTITTTNLNLLLHNNVKIPFLNYNGTGKLRIKGLGSISEAGGATGVAVDTSGGSGSLFMENVYSAGLKLNSQGIFKAVNVDFFILVEFATGTNTAHKYFQNCIFLNSLSESVKFTEAGVDVFFDNCIFDTTAAGGNNHCITFTNTTTAPTNVFLKDCLMLCNSSKNAFHKTSSNTTVSLDFVGGVTGMSYFGNPSDFTIRGNYICQTTLNNLPYTYQQ